MRVGTSGFVAERLTEGREARGLSQTALAELTGIKPQSISHYEQSRQSPSPEALALLCEKLCLPERYFLRPYSHYSSDGIFFRDYRPATKAIRLKAERQLNWAKEVAAALRRHIDLPAPRIPDGAGSPEDAAELCRAELGIGSGPAGDLIPALENAGCIVSRSGIDKNDEGSYSQWDCGTPYIALAENLSPARVRFDAAHELGHLTMHRSIAKEQSESAEAHRMAENDADRFARAFLLPGKLFGREVWAANIDALASLKKIWNCPVSEMIVRCGEIGIFDSEQVRRALVNHSRRGWKHREPHDEEAAAESPTLLARGIRLLIEEGGRHPHAVVTNIGLAATDVEELACLPRGYFAERPNHNKPMLRLRTV